MKVGYDEGEINPGDLAEQACHFLHGDYEYGHCKVADDVEIRDKGYGVFIEKNGVTYRIPVEEVILRSLHASFKTGQGQGIEVWRSGDIDIDLFPDLISRRLAVVEMNLEDLEE